MKNFFKQIFWILGLALCMPLASCNVSEFEDDCLVETQLRFTFSRGGTVLLGYEVPSLSVFVFDGEDKYFGRFDEMDFDRIHNEYSMILPLPPGDYSFVIWGGLIDNNYYLSSPDAAVDYVLEPVVGETLKSQFALRASRTSRSSYATIRHYVDYVPGALFFGDTEPVELIQGKDRTIDVNLIKYTNTINLTVIGLPESGALTPRSTRADNPYGHIDVNLASSNGAYDFYGNLASNRANLTYPQHNASEVEELTQASNIYTIRPVFGQEHTLSFYNTETESEYYSLDLLDDAIRKVKDNSGNYVYNTQEAVDEEDPFNITIDLRPEAEVAIKVNGWTFNAYGGDIQ